ncbi:hypothetical protein [Streptomyces incarnatus]|uniref:hypothetical protein n=1 Tax=Streptomyces incarnatus TaxID=665007 RepID=UPI001AD82BBF|nr:hypothetical protein [Streptomyces incarnatus]
MTAGVPDRAVCPRAWAGRPKRHRCAPAKLKVRAIPAPWLHRDPAAESTKSDEELP